MNTAFPSLRIEGGLFSPDLPEAVLQETLPGQKPADFNLPAGRRGLTEEIAALYHDARTLWQVFRRRVENLPEDDPATTETRNLWVIPLLSLLGYNIQFQPRAFELDGLTFAVSHTLLPAASPHPTPVHIVGYRQELGRVAASGRPRLSPHALVQEYLNRSEALWGLVTNGRVLRLLRNSTYLRRQAYLEFDLESLFEQERFPDFVLLYRLLHRTRLPADGRPEDCWLERYYQQSIEQGGRVREHLRDGVEECLKKLANGFLGDPRNGGLRQWVSKAGATAFYQQLLRLVYRFLFLLVSEERGLMGSNPLYLNHYGISRLRRLAENRAAYTADTDLWHGLSALWKVFQDEGLAGLLGVPPLNGELFAHQELDEAVITNRSLLDAFQHLCFYGNNPPRRVNYAALDTEELGSVYESLLDYHPAVWMEDGRPPVFDLAPGSERKSTGSFYTPPQLVSELITSALQPVIEARLKAAASPAEREQALLSIKVCDPACGSGHFLLAAARRLGKELARLRSGEDEPAPEVVRAAIRDVVARCIYGVDKNPLAVELARVALWIESHAAGKPLTFLEHRIKCGDSLVGVFDLSVLQNGLPDGAFDPLEGDDKKLAASLKRQNKAEREGQLTLFNYSLQPNEGGLASLAEQLNHIPDDTPEQVRAKRQHYLALRNDPALQRQKAACDLWTAAFFQSYSRPGPSPSPRPHPSPLPEGERPHPNPLPQGERPHPSPRPHPNPLPEGEGDKGDKGEGVKGAGFSAITSETVRRALAGQPVPPQVLAQAQALAEAVNFFHWPLEFPEVFLPLPEGERPHPSPSPHPTPLPKGERPHPLPHPTPLPLGEGVKGEGVKRGSRPAAGFDVLLANPPWERIKLQEQEFFASRDPAIAAAPNAAARKRLIDRLPQENPALWDEYRRALHTAESTSRFLRGSDEYPLTGRGDINTYSVFAERIRRLLAGRGRAGLILPTGIATDATNQFFFADLVQGGQIVSLYDFDNRAKLFADVISLMKFCLLTITGEDIKNEKMEFSFFCHLPEDIRKPIKLITLTTHDLTRLNPNTRTLPVFRTRQDADLTRAIYSRVPVLIHDTPLPVGEGAGVRANPWGVRFLRMLDMSNDSHLFRTRAELERAGYRLTGNRFVKARPRPHPEGEFPHPNPLPEGEGVKGEGVKGEGVGNDLYLPLYEAKMIWHYDHRYATYAGADGRSSTQLPALTPEQHADPAHLPQPWYWVAADEVQARLENWPHGWLLGFRDICRATDERTAIFSLLPKVGVGNNLPCLFISESSIFANLILSNFDSLVFDYVTRQKIAGIHMNFFFVSQLPVLPPAAYTAEHRRFILPRVLELTYTAWNLKPFADDVWKEAGDDPHPNPLPEGERPHPNPLPEGEGINSPLPVGEGQGVRDKLRQRARQLRQNATPAEQILWQALRNRQLNGLKFRRQHPIGRFILDFYCAEKRLAVEVDGGQHADPDQRRDDQARTAALAAHGITVLRFWNHEVLNQLEAVLQAILETADQLPSGRPYSEMQEVILDQWQENAAATGGHPWQPPDWAPLAPDGCPLPPFRWDEDRRAVLRAELDAYYARLYGLTRKQLRYILDPADLTPRELDDILDPYEEVADPLDPAGYATRCAQSDFPGETFRVLKEKEMRQYGEYRTRRLVLEAWRRLAGLELPPADMLNPSAAGRQPPAAAEPPAAPPPAPVSAAPQEPPPSPAATDYGLYRCAACGKMVLGFSREEHIRQAHGGQAIQFEKIR